MVNGFESDSLFFNVNLCQFVPVYNFRPVVGGSIVNRNFRPVFGVSLGHIVQPRGKRINIERRTHISSLNLHTFPNS